MTAPFVYIERELRELLRMVEGLREAGLLSVAGIPYDQLADVVKRTREQRKESQRAVAAIAGVDQAVIWRIEKGKPVTARQLAGVARWLGIPIVFPP